MIASNNASTITEEKLAEIESRARAAFWGRGDKYGHGGESSPTPKTEEK